MVGVPGRSRACQPCKKRRVACDLQQPECSRCVKASRECTYGNGRIFVLNDEGSHKTRYRKTDGILASPHNADAKQSPNGEQSSDTISESSNDASDPVAQALLLYKSPTHGVLTQQALLAHALDARMVYNTATLGSLAYSMTSSMEDCLKYAFLACYTGWLGQLDQNKRLTNAGQEFYIKALRETHTALVAPDTAYADATLAACSALGIYEALECPERTMKAYYWHRAACYRLIRLRGPEAHQDGPAHSLFTNFRFFGVLHAFDNNHETFFACPEWTTIPFAIHPKNAFDELIDIFALGPETSMLGKSMPTLAKDQVFPTALQILGKLSIIKQKLQKFYSELESTHPTPLYWERVSPTSDDIVSATPTNSEFAFPPTLWFHDLEIANILTLYWAILAMVWSGLTDLYSLFNEHGAGHFFNAAMGESNEFEPQSMEFLAVDRARKVLQSVAFCTSSSALESGPPRCGTQLAIVIDVMKNRKGCEAEAKWAIKARKRMGVKWYKIFHSFDNE